MFEMKKRLRWSALKAGLVITLALLIIFAVVMYAGTIKGILTPSVEFEASFRDVKGLRKGAPVWLFGTEVGSVKDIRLNPVYGTVVSFSVERDAVGFLRSNSQAEILTMGLLGDKYVELTPGSPRAGPIEPGEVIKGKVPQELPRVIEESAKTIEKTSELINKVDSLISSISKGHGVVSKLLNDPTLYNNLVKSTAAFQATLERFQKSRGTLNLLIENPSLYDRTLAAVSDLEQITKKLKAGQGTLGKLVEDPQLYENLNRSAKNLDGILSSIDKGKGMAGAFVRDEELVTEVKKTLLELRGLAEEMNIVLKDIKEHPEKYFQFRMF
jgi:phospholipid/cholesterol/gamma-HCH transport system substrate-binding protein